MKTMQLMVAETESDRGTLDSANDDDEFGDASPFYDDADV